MFFYIYVIYVPLEMFAHMERLPMPVNSFSFIAFEQGEIYLLHGTCCEIRVLTI